MDDLRRGKFCADYAILGGLALSAWVRPRTTRDVDLAVMLAEVLQKRQEPLISRIL